MTGLERAMDKIKDMFYDVDVCLSDVIDVIEQEIIEEERIKRSIHIKKHKKEIREKEADNKVKYGLCNKCNAVKKLSAKGNVICSEYCWTN